MSCCQKHGHFNCSACNIPRCMPDLLKPKDKRDVRLSARQCMIVWEALRDKQQEVAKVLEEFARDSTIANNVAVLMLPTIKAEIDQIMALFYIDFPTKLRRCDGGPHQC